MPTTKGQDSLKRMFKKYLKKAIGEGFSHQECDHLAGCTSRKLVLSEAEGEAGKRLFQQVISQKLWDLFDKEGTGWLFGSPKTMLNIGLVPTSLARQRLGLNSQDWDTYKQIV